MVFLARLVTSHQYFQVLQILLLCVAATGDDNDNGSHQADGSSQSASPQGNAVVSESSERSQDEDGVGGGDLVSGDDSRSTEESDSEEEDGTGGMRTVEPGDQPTTSPPPDGGGGKDDEDEEDNGDEDNGEDDGQEPTTGGGPLPPSTQSYCLQNPSQNPVKCSKCDHRPPVLPDLNFLNSCNLESGSCMSQGTHTINGKPLPPIIEDLPVLPAASLSTTEKITIAIGVVGVLAVTGGVALWAYKTLALQRAANITQGSGNQTNMAARDGSEDVLHEDRRVGSVQTISSTV